MQTNRKFLVTGAIFGLIAVILGAFAAHGLKETLSEASLNSFETGVRFQMYHAFLMLILGIIITEKDSKLLFYLFLYGTLLFSGSIYLLSTSAVTGVDFSAIALVTPIGGGLLIVGWFLLVLKFIKLKNK